MDPQEHPFAQSPDIQSPDIPSPDPAPTGHRPGDPSAEFLAPAEEAMSPLSFGRFFLKEVIQIILPAIVLAVTIHLFLAQATVVYGQSMEPNLHPLERLVIEKVSYRLHPPKRFDIVVVDLPIMDELLIKRIVGLPGETVEIRDGILYIDGQPVPEPEERFADGTNLAPVTLGPDSYFVLGDNRANSNDSRVFGPIHRSNIVGRAWLRYWPLERITQFE